MDILPKKIINYYGYFVDYRVKKIIQKLIINISNIKYKELIILLKYYIINIDFCYNIDIDLCNENTLKINLISKILDLCEKSIYKDYNIITINSFKNTIIKEKDIFILYNFLKLDDPFERNVHTEIVKIDYLNDVFIITTEAKHYLDNILNSITLDEIHDSIINYDLSYNLNISEHMFDDETEIKEHIMIKILKDANIDIVDNYKFKNNNIVELEHIKRAVISDIEMLTLFRKYEDFKNMLLLTYGEYPVLKSSDLLYHIANPAFINNINKLF